MMRKQILSVVLMLCMVLIFFPSAISAAVPLSTVQPVAADDSFQAFIEVGGKETLCDFVVLTENPGTVTIGYEDEENQPAIGKQVAGEVIIPKTVKNIDDKSYTVTGITQYAFGRCGEITNVKIPDSVTTIGVGAFYGCAKLQSITIADSVTSIGDAAFLGCTQLTDISIPKGVGSIGNSTFSGCTQLAGVNIPDSVTSIGSKAFFDCRGLIGINIPKSVTSIGNSAFSYCTELTSIDIPQGITRIEDNVFDYCTQLTSVSLPNGLTSIGESAFEECIGLTGIRIPGSVASIGIGAFFDCSVLSSVIFEGSAPAIDKFVFTNTSSELKIYIPKGDKSYAGGEWDAWSNSIAEKIGFTDQPEYDIPVMTIGTTIAPIDVSGGVSGGVKPYTFEASGLPSGIAISSAGVISGTPTAVCGAGTASVTAADGMDKAGITISYGAVQEKSSNPVPDTVPDPARHTHNYSETVWNTDTADHWHECTALGCPETIKDRAAHTPGDWITKKAASVSQTGSQYTKCTICGTAMVREIPKLITFSSGSYAYEEIFSDGADAAAVKVMGFAKGKSASKVTIKKTVSYKDKVYKITEIADRAFYKKNKIKQISLDNNVAAIGDKAFYSCTGLKKVTIGTGLKSIGSQVFANDKKLTSLTIKSTKLQAIGKKNLYHCQNLKIKVPSSKVKAYAKLFKNQGQKSNVKITR